MKNRTRIISLVLSIVLLAVLSCCLIACEEKEVPVTISSYDQTIKAKVGDEFSPTVQVTKSDESTATLTLLTNAAVEMPDGYFDTLKLAKDDADKVTYTTAGTYAITVLYCGDKLALTFEITE